MSEPIKENGEASLDPNTWPAESSVELVVGTDYLESQIRIGGKPVACSEITVRLSAPHVTEVVCTMMADESEFKRLLGRTVVLKGTLHIDSIEEGKALVDG